MATLRILAPDSTINYVKNPSMRYDTNGWNAAGATLTRSTNYARFGIGSLQTVTNGSALNEGAYYRVSSLVNVSAPITVSVYVRGTGRVRCRLIDNPNGQEWAGERVTLRSDRWTRLSVSGYSTGSNDLRLYVESDGDAAQVITFYADGAQMERKPYPTTYCDGDQPGCRWAGQAHNSNASRSQYTRSGGRWVTLAGPEQEEKNLYMTNVGGMGFAPIKNNIQSYSLLPGSYFQNVKVDDRVFTLLFHAKNEDRRGCDTATLARLHQLRQLMIDLVKPDRTHGGDEFMVEYQDGETPLRIWARYDGGLEGEWDVRNKWINSFPVRLLAVSPFFVEDNQNVEALDFQSGLILNDVAARLDGEWSGLNFGFNNTVYDLVAGRTQEIIAVGAMTVANNDAGAIDPLIPANRIAYWDGEQWNLYSSGANGTINAVAVAPNGNVYVTGDFTSIGGVAADRIAYWDGSTWNAMSTGLNAQGRAIQVAPNGHVFVGGDFTTAGGLAAYYIARWDGSSWFSLGTNTGLNNSVYALEMSLSGLALYVGGNFTDENGNPGSGLTRVANYSVPLGTFAAMGSGFNALVRALALSPSNILYAGGDFTTSGTDSLNYVAEWRGSTWIALGAGMNDTVHSMDVSPTGDLVAVGQFSEAGGVTANRVALWNGSTWVNLDIQLSVGGATVEPFAVLFAPNGDLYIGGADFSDGVHSSLFSGITLVNNLGSAEVSPWIYISGPATLRWIENQTTRKRAFFDLAVQSGEEIFIDFGAAKIESTLRGNLSYAMLPGSDFRAFTLVPGENKIASLMIDDVAATMRIGYTPTHWSVDATDRGEEL